MTNKRKLLFILIALFMISTMAVQISAEGNLNISISGNNVTIAGKTYTANEKVTLQVYNEHLNKAARIDQIKSDENGSFTFSFPLDYYSYKAVVVSETNRFESRFNLSNPSDDSDSDSKGGSGSSGGTTPPAGQQPSSNSNINIVLDKSNGAAKVTIVGSKIIESLAAAKPDSNGVRQVTLEIPRVAGANSYNIGIPGNLLSKSTALEKMLINTELCSLNIQSNMFTNTGINANKNIDISVKKANAKMLDENLQKLIGSKPIIDIDILVDGKEISWKNDESPIEISFNYTPTAEELKHPEHIIVWYIDSTGNVISVPSGKYDVKSGKVTFKTNHLSRYAVVYSKKSFEDISKYKWAEKQIQVMASKGIVEGKTDKLFKPSEAITRGEYLSWMVKALGLTAKVDGNFADVTAADKNYTEIAIARKLGIAMGGGDNKYRPDDTITRQDIMVLTDRALHIMKRVEASDGQLELKVFWDADQISGYAKASMANMVKAKLINGSGSKINPKGMLTRAEAAVLVYRLYNK